MEQIRSGNLVRLNHEKYGKYNGMIGTIFEEQSESGDKTEKSRWLVQLYMDDDPDGEIVEFEDVSLDTVVKIPRPPYHVFAD